MIFRPIPRGSRARLVSFKCSEIFRNILLAVKEITWAKSRSPYKVVPEDRGITVTQDEKKKKVTTLARGEPSRQSAGSRTSNNPEERAFASSDHPQDATVGHT